MSSSAVGSGIVSQNIKKKDNTVSHHLVRYVFNPLLPINLSDRNITGAMSRLEVSAKQFNNIVDVPYKVRDESSDVLLDTQMEVEKVPLTEYIHTAKEQADFLYTTYGERGVVVLEALTGMDAEVAIEIERAIFPEYFGTLFELSKYLTDDAKVSENLKNSGISGDVLKKAKATVNTLKVGVSKSLEFSINHLNEAKAEIINARNGKSGKSSHDPFDLFLYEQTGTPILKERDVEFAHTKDVANNSGNQALASAIEKLSAVVAPEANDEKVKALENQVALLASMVEKLTGQSPAPAVEEPIEETKASKLTKK